MAAYTAGFMALVTCGLTAEDRHQLWNPALVLRQTASDVGGPYSIPGEWNAQNVITWSLSDRPAVGTESFTQIRLQLFQLSCAQTDAQNAICREIRSVFEHNDHQASCYARSTGSRCM